MRRGLVLATVTATLGAAGAAYYLTRPGGSADPPPADPLRVALAGLEREVEAEQRLRARGLVTDWDVDYIQVTLARARYDLALTAGNRAEMGNQLRAILAIWERDWERLRPGVEHGTAAPVEAEDGQRRIAVARYRLAEFEGRAAEATEQLRLVAAAWDRRVQRLSTAYAHRAASLRDLNLARYQAGCARYLRAGAGGRAEDIRAESDRAVALWEAEAARVGPLHQTGAARHFENFQARHYLATVRLRRACLDGNREVAVEQLRARIQVADDALPGLDSTDPFLRRQRPGIEWQRAFDRASLERLQRDGTLPPDTVAADLDW